MRQTKFQVGYRSEHRVVLSATWATLTPGVYTAVGLSSGFLEPRESTSIHLIQNSILRLIRMFPAAEIDPAEVSQFNNESTQEIEQIRDFIILHYKVTQRLDSKYWVDCKEMTVPESLTHKIALFKSNARAARDNNEAFHERSWAAVMLGQGIKPRGYHPFVDNLSDQQLQGLLSEIKTNINRIMNASPSHQEFLAGY